MTDNLNIYLQEHKATALCEAFIGSNSRPIDQFVELPNNTVVALPGSELGMDRSLIAVRKTAGHKYSTYDEFGVPVELSAAHDFQSVENIKKLMIGAPCPALPRQLCNSASPMFTIAASNWLAGLIGFQRAKADAKFYLWDFTIILARLLAKDNNNFNVQQFCDLALKANPETKVPTYIFGESVVDSQQTASPVQTS